VVEWLIEKDLLAPALSVASGLTIAFLSVYLAFGRYRSERWWERRADSYASVTRALNHFIAYYDNAAIQALGFSEFLPFVPNLFKSTNGSMVQFR
jgi:hypothetical protein